MQVLNNLHVDVVGMCAGAEQPVNVVVMLCVGAEQSVDVVVMLCTGAEQPVDVVFKGQDADHRSAESRSGKSPERHAHCECLHIAVASSLAPVL